MFHVSGGDQYCDQQKKNGREGEEGLESVRLRL